MGTFTAYPRPGRWSQVVKTVRYYPHIGAWVNKIGLRNPGIDSLNNKNLKDKIVSIHGFNDSEWGYLFSRIAHLQPLAVELNISCPNVPGGKDYPQWLFKQAPKNTIVKLPPVNYETIFYDALNAGIKVFHATNTIPVPSGGISGKPLKPFALAVVRELKAVAPYVTIIGGGGITTPEDIEDYSIAGADHFAIGTGSLAFWNLRKLK